VWRVTHQGGGKFTISQGSANQCLMFHGVDPAERPTRLLWGNGDNGWCGFSSSAALLGNNQALWTITIQ
jgi:hypothetical protein